MKLISDTTSKIFSSLINTSLKTSQSLFGYYEEKSNDFSFSLSFKEVFVLISFLLCVVYAIFAPWIVNLDPTIPVDINVEEIKPPFEGFHNILGTDAFARDLLDLFLLGMHKSYLFALLVVIFQISIVIPLAIVFGFYMKKNSTLGKLIEPLILFPAVFYYLILVAVFEHSSFIVYSSILLAVTIYTFYNHYRDVVQIMSLPMIKTLKMDGANFKHIVSIVLVPVLIPHTARLLRRGLILVVTDLILISTLHIAINPLSPHWGNMVFEAWHHRDLNNYSLIILTVLIVFVLYVSSSSFLIFERYLRAKLKNRADRVRKERASTFNSSLEQEF